LGPDEKVLLLAAVGNKEIDPKQFDENTLCACGYRDYFLALMVSATSGARIVILGGAERAAKVIEDIIVNNGT
jgi:hypothetical protein